MLHACPILKLLRNYSLNCTPLSPITITNSMVFTLGHACYTQTAWEKLISYCEETLPYASLNICTVGSIFSNIRIQVEQVFSGHTNIVKEKLGIVNSVETHFVPHVMDLDSWHHFEVLVSNRNQDTMNTWRWNNLSMYDISTTKGGETWSLGVVPPYYKLHTKGYGFQDSQKKKKGKKMKFQLAIQRKSSQMLLAPG